MDENAQLLNGYAHYNRTRFGIIRNIKQDIW